MFIFIGGVLYSLDPPNSYFWGGPDPPTLRESTRLPGSLQQRLQNNERRGGFEQWTLIPLPRPQPAAANDSLVFAQKQRCLPCQSESIFLRIANDFQEIISEIALASSLIRIREGINCRCAVNVHPS